ncbi:miraculin-like [Nymphaea colorata]|nr:miraculin-like [Nymphaea colorata]
MAKKTSMLVIFSLAALFLLVSTGEAAALPGRILDTDGNPLKSRTAKYYISPVVQDNYGGLTAEYRTNGTYECPKFISQEDYSTLDGVTASFWPVDGRSSVRLATDLNVEFHEWNPCPEKPIWTLPATDRATGQRMVRYGGVIGNAGPETVNNWFRIQQSGKNYKLVFCPSVCKTCKAACADLGLYYQNGQRWLVLGGRPFEVKFKRFSK